MIRLEQRLAHYHEELEENLDHDRKFQLKATWGIVNASLGFGAVFGVCYVANHWLHLQGIILGAVAGFAALLAYGMAFAWSDKGREGDEKKLSRLLHWKDVT